MLNGIVNSTPIQNPNNPTNEPIKATNTNRKITKTCLPDKCKLELIAAIAFCLPNRINGIVNTVNKPIIKDRKPPRNGIL